MVNLEIWTVIDDKSDKFISWKNVTSPDKKVFKSRRFRNASLIHVN